jgi:hypothetical protein
LLFKDNNTIAASATARQILISQSPRAPQTILATPRDNKHLNMNFMFTYLSLRKHKDYNQDEVL